MHKNSQMILSVWGWQSGRKARALPLESDEFGLDPSSVSHQLQALGWTPETHWVSRITFLLDYCEDQQ